jgi:hypothetical protein
MTLLESYESVKTGEIRKPTDPDEAIEQRFLEIGVFVLVVWKQCHGLRFKSKISRKYPGNKEERIARLMTYLLVTRPIYPILVHDNGTGIQRTGRGRRHYTSLMTRNISLKKCYPDVHPKLSLSIEQSP